MTRSEPSRSWRTKEEFRFEQIQLSLGHESIQTTKRYLGIRQDLTDAPCDYLGIEFEE